MLIIPFMMLYNNKKSHSGYHYICSVTPTKATSVRHANHQHTRACGLSDRLGHIFTPDAARRFRQCLL